MTNQVRVRFAPSPTGRMHIGNVRAALCNYIFARQRGGTFILRIEDTDQQRNVSGGIEQIVADLAWLGLVPDEGPSSLSNEPYFQSQRQAVYTRALARLMDKGYVYRCYCTPERLELLREEQRQASLPPRYDGHCRDLSDDEWRAHSADGTPFVWRFRRPESMVFSVPVSPGSVQEVAMQHFYDFPLTRADESFTFLFSNVVDDIEMGITHVIRGQDHQTNTGAQAALYYAFGAPWPLFVHLPLLCGVGGKKLSKRDAGFSLAEVQAAGIVPAALKHYLLTLGSTTIDHLMSDADLVALPFFERLSSSMITYDLAALRSVNKRYLAGLPLEQVIAELVQFDDLAGGELRGVPITRLQGIVTLLRGEVATLSEMVAMIVRVTKKPELSGEQLLLFFGGDKAMLLAVTETLLGEFGTSDSLEECFERYKASLVTQKIPQKLGLSTLRYLVTGGLTGYAIGDLLRVVPAAQLRERITQGCAALLV